MCFHWFEGGQLDRCPGRDIEAGAVPRALDLVTLQLTLIQRAAVMRAQVIDRIELTVHVAHRYVVVADAKYRDTLWWNVARRGDSLPVRHCRVRSSEMTDQIRSSSEGRSSRASRSEERRVGKEC